MDIKMFNSTIDNGSHFEMRARNITGPAWKNSFEVENEPGKSIGSSWNVRTPSFRYNGYEAPVVTFIGIIDESLASMGSRAGGSMFITTPRLGSFALIGSAYILYPFLGRFLARAGFDNSFTGSVPCIIENVTPTIDTNYMAGSEYIVNYNMQIRLVSGF
jgi:hypothetical protein